MSRPSKSPQQAAVVPFRRRGQAAQVCLICRKTSRKWGIPKGFIDPGDTSEEAALNEAWEEAGLNGRIVGDPVGMYDYDKWGSTYTVVVHLMEVLEQEKTWQEMRVRQRRWVALDDALQLLADHPVRALLDGIVVRLSSDGAEP